MKRSAVSSFAWVACCGRHFIISTKGSDHQDQLTSSKRVKRRVLNTVRERRKEGQGHTPRSGGQALTTTLSSVRTHLTFGTTGKPLENQSARKIRKTHQPVSNGKDKVWASHTMTSGWRTNLSGARARATPSWFPIPILMRLTFVQGVTCVSMKCRRSVRNKSKK